MRDFARLAFFFARRHFHFLGCKTKNCFECKCKTFRLLKFKLQIWLRAMRMSQNELVQKSYNKGAFCCKPLYKTSNRKICQQSINSIIFMVMRRQASDRPARTLSVVFEVASHDSLRVRFLIQQAYSSEIYLFCMILSKLILKQADSVLDKNLVLSNELIKVES